MQKYQPKKLTDRHRAILRSLFVGNSYDTVSTLYDVSVSQIARVRHSVLGKEYLKTLNRAADAKMIEMATAMPIIDSLLALKKKRVI